MAQANGKIQAEVKVERSGVGDALDFANRSATQFVDPPDDLTAPVIFTTHEDRVVDVLDVSRYAAAPAAPAGQVTLRTAASFVDWVARHAPQLVVGPDIYASADTLQVVAVLDWQTQDQPAWEEHRALLQVVRHPRWVRWRDIDGKFLEQAAFAEHVQRCAADIADPPAADLLEIAETLTVNVGAKVSTAHRLRDGQRRIVFEENSTAAAGYEREVEIPEVVTVAVPIFDGLEPVTVEARLLYRRSEGRLLIGVQLLDPDEAERAQFDEIAASIELGLPGVSVYAGRPNPPRR